MKNPVTRVETTRSGETESRYRALVRSLLTAFGAMLPQIKAHSPNTSDAHIFAGFISSKYQKQSKPSRRWIIAALQYYFAEVQPHPEVIAWLPRIVATWPEPGPLPLRTSAQKLTSVTQHELLSLEKQLLLQGRAGREALLWIICTGITALRPCEWLGARLVRIQQKGVEEIWLIVRNAKYSNGRSFADERRLNVSGLPSTELACIQKLLTIVGLLSGPDEFRRFQRRVQAAIRRANLAAFPRRFCRLHVPRQQRRSSKSGRHPTLYTMRHLFTATLKASGRSRQEVAALLGHGCTRTAARHYARAAPTGITLGIQAHPEDVALIKDNVVPLPHAFSLRGGDDSLQLTME